MKTLLTLTLSAFLCALFLGNTFIYKPPGITTPECYISCFNTQVTEDFRREVNQNFAALHAEPRAFKLDAGKGKMISFTTADGRKAMAYEIKAKKATNNYLIVLQEWWGLNVYIKKEAERLHDNLEHVNVLALDLYDGKVATTRDSALKYVQAASSDRIVNIINGSIAYAGKDARIYTIGWCFGGMWSLQAAILGGKKTQGCVMYYGRPDTDVEKLKQLNTDVLGIFGSKDNNPSPKKVEEFEAAMNKAGKTLIKNLYDAGHGFANPSNPNHNEEATEDAWKKTIAYLKQKMRSSEASNNR